MPAGSVAARAARAKPILVNSDIAHRTFLPIVNLPRLFSKQFEMIIYLNGNDSFFGQ
jgi:hypothetical protein